MTDKSLVLIDLSSIWRAAWHSSADQELSAAFEKTVGRVHRHIAESRTTHAAVCLDAPPYTHRTNIFPQYKAQREKPPPQMFEQFRRVKERLSADGLLLWSAPGFEADDVIATATKCAIDRQMAVTIVSSDKDLLQLVSDDYDVRVFSPASEVYYDRAGVVAKFGVAPEDMLEFLSLVGDKSDNVPGIEGVGPVKAAKLLAQWGSLHEVLAHADENTPKLAEALISGAENARLAKRVIALRDDVPIQFADLFEQRKQQPLTKPEDDGEEEMPEEESAAFESPEFISAPKPASSPANGSQRKSDPPPNGNGNRSTAIVIPAQSAPIEWSMQLEPTSLSIAKKMAGDLLNSRLFTRFTNEEAIFAVIIRGREMGLGALTSLAVMTFFEGKVALDAHYIVAKAKEHPDCEYFQFLGGDANSAEWETKNKQNPKPTRMKYTIDQAKLAGLCRPPAPGKQEGNWIKRPAEMLRKTAAVQLVRVEYPSAALGLVCHEEIGEES